MADRESLRLQPVQIAEQRQGERIAVREAEDLRLLQLRVLRDSSDTHGFPRDGSCEAAVPRERPPSPDRCATRHSATAGWRSRPACWPGAGSVDTAPGASRQGPPTVRRCRERPQARCRDRPSPTPRLRQRPAAFGPPRGRRSESCASLRPWLDRPTPSSGRSCRLRRRRRARAGQPRSGRSSSASSTVSSAARPMKPRRPTVSSVSASRCGRRGSC